FHLQAIVVAHFSGHVFRFRGADPEAKEADDGDERQNDANKIAHGAPPADGLILSELLTTEQDPAGAASARRGRRRLPRDRITGHLTFSTYGPPSPWRHGADGPRGSLALRSRSVGNISSW